jgi:hypothetical protein
MAMNPRIAFSFTVLLCMVIAIAGCAGTGPQADTPAPASTPAATETPEAVGMGDPTENDSLDSARSVTVNIEKDHLGMIRATFQGGPGLIHVRKIVVTVNRSDGEVRTAEVGITLDDSATLEGTKATDRAMVHVTFSDGKTYKIYDELVPFRGR